MNSLELREQYSNLLGQTRQWVEKIEAEGRDLNAEENNEWTKCNADLDRLEQDIKKAERKEYLENKEAGLRQPEARKTAPGRTEVRALNRNESNRTLRAWLAHGSLAKVNTDADLLARCADYGRPLHSNTIEFRSMNTSSGSAGGNATFTVTTPDIQTEMKYYSPILGRVKIVQTSDGNNWVQPRGTDVANTMSIVGQGSGAGTSTDPTFDKVTLSSYYFRYIEQVSYEMLEDGVFNVEQWLSERLTERCARTLEQYVVSGTGSSQPKGLIQAAIDADGGTPAVTLATGKKAFDTFDTQLFPLFKAVDLAYRPNNTLVIHDSSVWDLRSIKDSQGRYIWDVNNTLVQNAQPDRIAGWNYLVSNSMDASGAFSKNIAVFADLSRMLVRMVDGIQITRLSELYRASGLIGFEVRMRFDSAYIGHAASIARVKTAAS